MLGIVMKNHRGKLFVDPAFQGRLLLRLTVYWIVYNVAIWHLLFLFSMFSRVIKQVPAPPEMTLLTEYRAFALDHMIIPICFLVTLPIFGRDLLKFSHRLAGPLIRFREVMREMADGKAVSEVKLRRADLPSDFLAVFNKLVATWNGRLADSETAKSPRDELELVESA